MALVKVVDRWEEGTPSPIPPDTRIRAHSGGEISDQFFATVYVDDYLLVRVQRSDDKTALMASASLASDHTSFLGPGEQEVSPIFAPKKNTNWDSTIDALRFTGNSHTMRISFPRENANDIKRLLLDQGPLSRRRESARDVLSVAGKLWNLTYVRSASGQVFRMETVATDRITRRMRQKKNRTAW